jgi:high-affinity Fe2+/Pb2+ permease
MTDFSSLAMAFAMIAALLLVAGGIKLSLAPQTRKRGILMIVAAVVIVTNVMIWTV